MVTNEIKKALFVEAQKALHPSLRGDNEYVKSFRDDVIMHYTGKASYKLLTLPEAEKIIQILKNMARGTSTNESIIEQKNKLKAKTMALGIKFALAKYNFNQLTVKVAGGFLTGKELKKYCQKQYDEGTLTWNIRTHLFNNFVNAHLNQYLIEGKFKKRVNNPNAFYWSNHTNDELKYLIKRLEIICNNYEYAADLSDVQIAK